MVNLAQNIEILSMVFVPVLIWPKLNQRGHFEGHAWRLISAETFNQCLVDFLTETSILVFSHVLIKY